MDIEKVWKIKSAETLEDLEVLVQEAQDSDWIIEKIDVRELIVVISKKKNTLHG